MGLQLVVENPIKALYGSRQGKNHKHPEQLHDKLDALFNGRWRYYRTALQNLHEARTGNQISIRKWPKLLKNKWEKHLECGLRVIEAREDILALAHSGGKDIRKGKDGMQAGRFYAKDWHKEAWIQVKEWMEDPVFWASVVWMTELAAVIVKEQKWVREPSKLTGFPSTFVHAEMPRRILEFRLTRCAKLQEDPLHPDFFSQTRKLVDAMDKPHKEDFMERARKGRDAIIEETKGWHVDWVQSPKVLGLIADPDLGPIFIRNLAKLLPKCNFKPKKTVQRAAHIDPKLQTAVDDLFKQPWHANYQRQFAALPAEHKFAKLKSGYNFKADIMDYWKTHQLDQYEEFFQHMANSTRFEFTEANVPAGLWKWFIRHHFIKSVSNLHLEGQFNLINIYGKAQIDQIRQEMLLLCVNNL